MADEDHTSAPPLQRLEVYTTNPDLPPCVGRSKTAPPLSWIRADPVFRDATHHFLRLFDQMFTKFAEAASDAEISKLPNTRTARAFMLLGRVTGTFN